MAEDIKRTLLQTSLVDGLPGWETRLYLIEYGPGADGGGHLHPARAVGYVLTGTMVSAFGDDAQETFHAGQSFQDKGENIVHTVARNASATEPMSFLVAYTVKTGEQVTIQPEK